MHHVVSLLLLPEAQTGIATDPTGGFAARYGINASALFTAAHAYAELQKHDPLFLRVVMFAPRPADIGFPGWKYEGWLVDQPPQGAFSSATSVHPTFGGVSHPTLDQSEYPISTGLFRDTGLALPNGLAAYTNTFTMNQTAWPYDLVVVTFEPPETGTGSQNYDPRPDPVRPIAGFIPGRIPK